MTLGGYPVFPDIWHYYIRPGWISGIQPNISPDFLPDINTKPDILRQISGWISNSVSSRQDLISKPRYPVHPQLILLYVQEVLSTSKLYSMKIGHLEHSMKRRTQIYVKMAEHI